MSECLSDEGENKLVARVSIEQRPLQRAGGHAAWGARRTAREVRPSWFSSVERPPNLRPRRGSLPRLRRTPNTPHPDQRQRQRLFGGLVVLQTPGVCVAPLPATHVAVSRFEQSGPARARCTLPAVWALSESTPASRVLKDSVSDAARTRVRRNTGFGGDLPPLRFSTFAGSNQRPRFPRTHRC